jgi:hypothetical protein
VTEKKIRCLLFIFLTVVLLAAPASGCAFSGAGGTATAEQSAPPASNAGTGTAIPAAVEAASPVLTAPPSDAPVPDAVREAAERYVQKMLAYHSRFGGAVYDAWRIDGLSLARSYNELGGEPLGTFAQPDGAVWNALDVYRLDFGLHTTTPDKAVLAGGAFLDDDNWLHTDSPYLLFAEYNGFTVYLLAMIDEVPPNAPVFVEDLTRVLTSSKEALGTALGHLRELFDDGASVIWYVPDGTNPSAAIPEKLSYVRYSSRQYEERYAVLFTTVWVRRENRPIPEGDCLLLGDSPQRCFRFYLGSDTVVWQDEASIVTWMACGPSGLSLPDAMMLDFSLYEADAANVTLPVKAGEPAGDTAARFLEAYAAYIKNMTPENNYRVEDLRILETSGPELTDTGLRFGFRLAVKPPAGLYSSSPWTAGGGAYGEGELEGWITNGKTFLLEKSGGVWRCKELGGG